MKTLLIYILCFVAIFSFAVKIGTPVAYATGTTYVPLAPIDVAGSEFKSTGTTCVFDTDPNTPSCLGKYLRTIYNVGIAMAGLFAVFSIVRGGFTLIFTDSILGHSEAKGIILRALGGLVIVYSSYIFMNQISPSLGRELDLSLNFDRISIREDKGTLAVVDNLSQYQLDLLREARVRNEEWRKGEKKRIDDEITALENNLRATEDDEEKGLIQGKIDQKRADLAALTREGVVKNVEHDASTAFQEATTPAQVETLINNITKGAGSNSIQGIHEAFDAMITTAKLTPEQIALLRVNEAARVASIHQSLAIGILEHPPTIQLRNPVTGLTSLVPDGVKIQEQVTERVNAISSEREFALGKLSTLKGTRPDLTPGIESQEKVIWNQSCNTIAQIRDQCRFKNQACENIPAVIKNACKTNSNIAF